MSVNGEERKGKREKKREKKRRGRKGVGVRSTYRVGWRSICSKAGEGRSSEMGGGISKGVLKTSINAKNSFSRAPFAG